MKAGKLYFVGLLSETTASEFHISRPEGLPVGRYQVEIFLDGASAGKRAFAVQ